MTFNDTHLPPRMTSIIRTLQFCVARSIMNTDENPCRALQMDTVSNLHQTHFKQDNPWPLAVMVCIIL